MAERMCWAVCQQVFGGPGDPIGRRTVALLRSEKRALAWISACSEKRWQLRVERSSRKLTILQIRAAVYERDQSACVACGELVTWQGMHLHERVPRSKGGIISIENCETRCADCHLNVSHGKRKPRFGRQKLEVLEIV